MRVLLTTRGSAGHLLPLVPFGQACVRLGHEVLVAAQRQNEAHVERTGLRFSPVANPPEDRTRGRRCRRGPRRQGLPSDPLGDRLRSTPYFTAVPERLEDPAVPIPARTHR